MEYSLHKLSIQNNRWIEKNIEKGQEYYKKIEILSQTFSIPDYFSKHLVDNKIDNQEKFINFINPSIYFLYPPFLFKDIFNALRLISEAKNNDSPIFIFGDSDIDGIAGIKILYEALHKYGIKKIFYSIPENNEPYGISIEKIDLAIKRGAKLIITVDNGISCIKEVEYAKTKGLKVIITDHHNPKEDIPEADAIINPKLENFSYPSCLSGAGVAWKLVEALIFSQTRIFEQNIIFCNVEIKNFHSKSKNNYIANLTFLFIKNLRIYKQYNFSFYIDIEDFDNVLNFNNYNKTATFSLGKILTKEQASKNIFLILSEAIENNSIFISDQSDLLLLIFKDLSIKINLNDIKSIKSLINDDDDFLSILSTYKMFYINKIDYLYFILYSTIRYNYPKCIEELESYLPYVTIATIADIMPVFNENRYIIAKGLNIINENKPEFITQILSSVVGVNYPLTTYDIIWKISPLLNSPGRFGKGDILLGYILSRNIEDSLIKLKDINDLNIKRTLIVDDIFNSIKVSNNDKFVLLIEKEGIEPGLTGLLASKFAGLTSKPVIFITKTKNGIFGSMRSKNSFNSFQFLSQFSEYFENFGGHHFATGFTVVFEKYEKFLKEINLAISKLSENIESESYYYTCEITFDELLDPQFEKWYKLLQPFGEEFKVPIFYSSNISLSNPIFIGRNNNYIKLKVYQDNISIDAIFFKNKQFINDIKLNSINSIVFEPYFFQNILTLMIQDIFV